MEFLTQIEPWHWLIIVFICLGMEALGASGFLLGSAFTGLLLFICVWVFPEISWPVQLMFFGVGSLVFSLAYWKLFRNINEKNDHPELNNRAFQLVGRILVLSDDLPNGQGRIQIGDTFWRVRARSPMTEGTTVVVSSYEGMTLVLTEHDK